MTHRPSCEDITQQYLKNFDEFAKATDSLNSNDLIGKQKASTRVPSVERNHVNNK